MPRSLIWRMMLKFSFTKSGERPSEGSSIGILVRLAALPQPCAVCWRSQARRASAVPFPPVHEDRARA